MKEALNMWLDGHPSDNPIGTTRENYNILVTDEIDSKKAEHSITKFSNYNKKCIGEIVLNNDDLILFNSDGSFGILIKETYTELYTGLNVFDYTVIKGHYILDNNKERIIVFTINGETKYVNIDRPITSLELFNKDFNVKLDLWTSINGDLLVGGYIPIIRFVREDDSFTRWSKDLTSIFIEGNKSEDVSTKGIRLFISNINTDYDYIEYGYVYQSNGVKQAFISNKVPITKNTATLDITNFSTNAINIADVVEDFAIYKKINHLVEHQGYLYGLGVENYTEQNNQSVVNNIDVKWTSVENTDIKNNKIKGFAHGEVYALTIKFKYHWGYGKRYPLIGRDSVAADLTDINGDPKWKVRDTCSIIGTEGNYTLGNFSFIQNENEAYKQNAGLPNGLIKYFKFPSVNFIKNNIYSADSSYGYNKTDILGIKISNLDLNNILDEDGNSALSYKIEYAKRTSANSSVVGQSIAILNSSASYGLDGNKRISLGGNFSQGSFTMFDNISYRIYVPELLSGDFSVSIDSLKEELDLKTGFLNHGSEIATTINKDNSVSAFNFPYIVSIFGESLPLSDNEINVLESKRILNNTVLNNIDNIYGEQHINIKTQTSLSITMDNSVDRGAVNLSDKLQASNTSADVATNGYENTVLVTLYNKKADYYENLENNIFASLQDFGNGYHGNADVFACFVPVTCYGRYINAETTNIDYSEDIDKQGQKDGGVFIKYFLCESVFNTNFLNETQISYYLNVNIAKDFINSDKSLDPNLFSISINKDYSISNDLEQQLFFNSEREDYDSYDPFAIVRSFKENHRLFDKDDLTTIPRNKGLPIKLVNGKDRLYIQTENSLFVTRGTDKAINDTQSNTIYLGVGDIFEYPIQEVQHSKLGLLGSKHFYGCITTPFGYCFVDQGHKSIILLEQNSIDVLSNKGMRNRFLSLLDGDYGDNPYAKQCIQLQYDDYNKRLIVHVSKITVDAQYEEFDTYEELKDSLAIGDIGLINGVFYKRYLNIEIPIDIKVIPYNELEIQKKETILTYSFITQGWTSFLNTSAERLIRLRNLKLYSTENNSIYKHNDRSSILNFKGINVIASVKYVFKTIDENNQLYTLKKIFWERTLPSLLNIYNDIQQSEEIHLIEKSQSLDATNFLNVNVRKHRNFYHFYKVKDVNNNMFTDSYVIIELRHAKETEMSLGNVKIELYEKETER